MCYRPSVCPSVTWVLLWIYRSTAQFSTSVLIIENSGAFASNSTEALPIILPLSTVGLILGRTQRIWLKETRRTWDSSGISSEINVILGLELGCLRGQGSSLPSYSSVLCLMRTSVNRWSPLSHVWSPAEPSCVPQCIFTLDVLSAASNPIHPGLGVACHSSQAIMKL